jgi:hypothetical protein
VLERADLFAKYLDGRMAFTQRAQLSRRARARRLEVMRTRILRLARELGAKHGPGCLLCFVLYEVGLRGIAFRLQAHNLSVVGRGCFVRLVEIDGEGLDLSLARGELCGRCCGLLGRSG